MRIALMGVGSLGTILGAYVAKNGGDMVLIDANKAHVDAMNKNGATITGKVDFNVPVKAITPEEMTGVYDIVFYLVKQTFNEVALKQLLPHLGENSVVCTLQNGVPEDAVAEIVGRERTIGGTVGWGATWLEPGKSMLTSEPDKMTFDIGELDGKITERAEKCAEILRLMCPTEVVTNLTGFRWSKLLINATLSGMSAVLGCNFGEVLDNEKGLKCVCHIGNETLTVAKELGIKVEPIQGHDLKVLGFENKKEREKKGAMYRFMYEPHRLLRASMLQDLEKGKRCEIDAINGIVCVAGKKAGIPTPINDKVVEIIKGIEEGKYNYGFKNLDLFEIPEIKEG